MNFWGGKGIGVYKMMSHCLDQQINPYRKAYFVNSYLFGHNKYGIREIAESSMGTRMYGCAGLELVAILKGNHIAYISKPPWDYAAGNVLLEEFGMVTSGLLVPFDI